MASAIDSERNCQSFGAQVPQVPNYLTTSSERVWSLQTARFRTYWYRMCENKQHSIDL